MQLLYKDNKQLVLSKNKKTLKVLLATITFYWSVHQMLNWPNQAISLNSRFNFTKVSLRAKILFIGGIAQWIAYLFTDPAAWARIMEPQFFLIAIVAELIDRSALLRVRVDSAKSLLVDQTHPILP